MSAGLARPDPEAVLLCQLPGLEAPMLRLLLERWTTAGAILRAPSSELRAAGLPPGLVARIVAAPRQRAAVEAGLKSLERMGIALLPLPADDYPWQLRDLPAAPLLLHVQGVWPPKPPGVAILIGDVAPPEENRGDAPAGEPEDDPLRAAGRQMLAALHAAGITVMVGAESADLLPIEGAVAILPYGLLLARNRVPESLRVAAVAGNATLVSVAPVNAPPTPELEQSARRLLVGLADGLLVIGDLITPLSGVRSEVYRWELHLDDGHRRRRSARHIPPGEAGALLIARTLGVHAAGATTVHQERLW